jgi:hypothetical protein
VRFPLFLGEISGKAANLPLRAGVFKGRKSRAVYRQLYPKEFFMKRNVFSLLGIIALAAVIGLGLAGCDNGNGSPDGIPGRGGDTALVGKWYDTQASANTNGTAGWIFTFNADATVIFEDDDWPNSTESWTAQNNVLTMYTGGTVLETFNYTVSGTTLTFTYEDDDDDVFYKKAN